MTMVGSCATAVVAVVAVGAVAAPSVHAEPGDTTVFVPLAVPQRLLDTRDAGAPLGAGGVVTVQVVDPSGQTVAKPGTARAMAQAPATVPTTGMRAAAAEPRACLVISTRI